MLGIMEIMPYKTAFLKTADTSKNIVVKPTKWAWEKGDTLALKGVPKYIFGGAKYKVSL